MLSPRGAVLVVFMTHGMVMAGWVSRIPYTKNKLAMSEGTLGLVLLAASLGIILSLPIVGGVINRSSSRRVTWLSGFIYASMLPLLMLMPSVPLLAIALFSSASSAAFMDVAMNAQAVEVERQTNRPLMSSFHGAFSVGNLIGAVLSWALIALQVGAFGHLIIFTVLSWFMLGGVTSLLLPDTQVNNKNDSPSPIFSFPPRAVLPLGLIAFCAAIGEGAMNDWAAVYLKDIVETSESSAVLGFAAFALTMTVGRFIGDYLIQRYGRAMMIQSGAMMASLGLVLAVLIPTAYLSIIGFALVGAGLALMIPIVFSVAGTLPDIPSGIGIASAASLGYLGFLAGPPIIGLLAEISSLRLSFIVVAVLLSSLVIITPYAMPPNITKPKIENIYNN